MAYKPRKKPNTDNPKTKWESMMLTMYATKCRARHGYYPTVKWDRFKVKFLEALDEVCDAEIIRREWIETEEHDL